MQQRGEAEHSARSKHSACTRPTPPPTLAACSFSGPSVPCSCLPLTARRRLAFLARVSLSPAAAISWRRRCRAASSSAHGSATSGPSPSRF